MLRYIIGISFITVVIIIVRALSDGKILKRHQYAIWLLIPVCMVLLPFFSINIQLAKKNADVSYQKKNIEYYVQETTAAYAQDEDTQTGQKVSNLEPVSGEDLIADASANAEKESIVEGRKSNGDLDWGSLFRYISFSVSAIMIVVLTVYNAGFAMYCKRNSRYIGKDSVSGLKIYGIDHKGTPFLLNNRIYIDKGTQDINKYVLCHEASHYKHGDHIWIWLRYLVLAINWYNPFIWAAFILSGRDCELACDEEVLSTCGADSSAGYAKTLFGIMQQRAKTPFSLNVSSGINDGYKTMKKRIASIKHPAKKSYRAYALCLAAVMIFSSCSFVKTDDTNKITKNTPWFTCNITDIDYGADPDREIGGIESNMKLAGIDDKYLVVYVSGDYKGGEFSPATDWDSFTFDLIDVIDRDTKDVVKTINAKKPLDKMSGESVRTVVYMNGKITVMTGQKEYDYDPLTGEITATRAASMKEIGWESHVIKAGEYLIADEQFFIDEYTEGCRFNITGPDGKLSTAELKEDNTAFYVLSLLPLNDTQVLIPVSWGYGERLYILDLTNCTLTEANAGDYDWIDLDQTGEFITGTDSKLYTNTQKGILRLNAEDKTFEEILDFNNCEINKGLLYSSRLVLSDCSDDSVLFIGQTKSSNYTDAPSDFQIIELTRAKKNPHSGKTILELYCPCLYESIGDAITKYNDGNDKYFIEVVYRYEEEGLSPADAQNIKTWDDNKIYMLNQMSNLSNSLITDIVAGNGPDILINSYNFGQLNNPDYLVDLTPYISDLNSDQYFTNIIEGSKTDGALYQLPIGFNICGIYTDQKEAGSSGKGFTLDEYSEFVHGTLNGTDLIEAGQAVYFAKLFNNMEDKFIVNGKADFSGPEFAALADYVRDNVPETIPPFGERELTEYEYQMLIYARVREVRGAGNFLDIKAGSSMLNAPTILGLPSTDGRGPVFRSLTSVAISAQATDTDACGEFVKILLSEDIQSGLTKQDNFVLNRKAFRDSAEDLVAYFNNGGSWGTPLSDEEKFTSADIDNIENVILSCSRKDNENSDISMILIEEMPAYFLGQKDLDAVITITQDRVQKVLDEKK